MNDFMRFIHFESGLSHYARCAASALSYHADFKTGENAYCSVSTMASFWDCSARSIQRGLRELEERDLIDKIERVGRTTLYKLVHPDLSNEVDSEPSTHDSQSQGGDSQSGEGVTHSQGGHDSQSPNPLETLPSNHSLTPLEQEESIEGEVQDINVSQIASVVPESSSIEKDSITEDQQEGEEVDDRLPHEVIRDAMIDYLMIEDVQLAMMSYTTREDRKRLKLGTISASLAALLGGKYTVEMLAQWATHKVGELISREVHTRHWQKAIANQGDLIAYFADIEARAARGTGKAVEGQPVDNSDLANMLA